ncbi:HD family phosphohydrolase [Paenibacillus allorhizosphaerae]|uniref:Cyclic-di-AMP phosphodiesterase PgpH n=1 Tax=Paenibacillus allorhizosphaerae TaxID=2849866 RepID=A0ABM8VBG0_9BACL|nr:HDIG domain-containing metalloprotein [Paenibacillus allorhizosphaerae]CAG7619984.1 Cyclic-di-AMP phosphodiesterase PgpH [Paenibacillus allorhizosphaerae]
MKPKVSIQGKFQYRLAGWRYSALVRFLLFFVLAVVIYFALYHRVVPQTYDIQLGSIAEKDILAPRSIPNEVATEKAKEEAAGRVQPVYKIVSLKNEIAVETIFEKLQQINSDQDVSLTDKVNIYKTVIPTMIEDHLDRVLKTFADSGQTNELLMVEMRKNFREQQYRIPEESFYKIPRLTKDDLAAMEPVAKEIVSKLMNDQILDAQTVRVKVPELVNASTLSKSITRELVQELVRAALTPNKFYDQKGTDEAKGHARDSVKPVLINKNDVLVAKGEEITKEIYDHLSSLDLLKDDTSYWPHLGLFLFTMLLCLVLYMYIRQSTLSISYYNVPLLMFVLIVIMTIAGMKVFSMLQNLEYPYIAFLAPTAMGAMLLAILLDAQLAFVAAVVFGIMASIVFNADHVQTFDYKYGLLTLTSSFAATFSIQRASQRASILKAGLMGSIFGVVLVASLLLFEDHEANKEALFAASFALGGGLLTAVFVIGLLPFLEVAFGILSPLKLVELSNMNHPLLRKLLTETPGTYHHSVMVGNLADTAAEAIGADGLLCRVGAYYHDIGKTKRPSYFIENQTNMENPHDKIDPALSKSIIVAHARDGVEMLKEYNIPKPIRDIAEQHHGTTLLQYFYHKAKKQAEEKGEKPPEESEYRYPGPNAQTKEAAIVGIADCVEAAVRSLRNPTVEQIDSMVRKIIKGRLDDGQFNECDLTIKELDRIAKALNETLLGIFHSRIEYPADISHKPDNTKEVKP